MRKFNRIKAKTPRGRHFWCDCCDRVLVNAGQKCPRCSHRSGKRRNKFSRRNFFASVA